MIRVHKPRRVQHVTPHRARHRVGRNQHFHSANHKLGPMQRAFKYPVAFKCHNYCNVGVILLVLVQMRMGLREVKFSPKVMWLQPGSAHNHRVSLKCGGFFGFRKKS